MNSLKDLAKRSEQLRIMEEIDFLLSRCRNG